MENTTADSCAICLDDVGRGQAIFTAECSHTFHLRCISDSVARGHRECPLCKATWRDVPAVDPAPAAPQQVDTTEPPREYDDDDPVAETGGVVQAQGAGAGTAADVAAAALKAHCERPAVPRDATRDSFAVLVQATAPGTAAAAAADAPRAPLDLVTVLDVSGSMEDEDKLALLKQAMGFVIDNLGPADRLSVVSFSGHASRVIRLVRMTGDGKALAKHAVQSLVADGCTNIAAGLRVASQVLADRRYRNAVTSIILLSDGQDNCNRGNHIDLVPPSFRGGAGAGNRPAPIHTFGFGTDHDAAAMHAIAEATRGTFSYIENHEVIQDSFAQCIGGLLSVVMQNVCVEVTCVHPGVRVREVKSGLYESRVDAEGRAAAVDVGELYADEERRFLVFVDVPRAEAAEEVTQLIRVRCTYRDAATGRESDVAADDAVVRRPVELLDGDDEVSVEVERERVRVAALEDMAVARAAAERGEHEEAARVLGRRRDAVMELQCAMSMESDEECDDLVEELDELGACVDDAGVYEETGRARVLCGMSSHRMQRASFHGRERERQMFQTKAARVMVTKSKKSRQEQQTSSTAPAPPRPPKRRRK